jgi:hypothetical protein
VHVVHLQRVVNARHSHSVAYVVELHVNAAQVITLGLELRLINSFLVTQELIDIPYV